MSLESEQAKKIASLPIIGEQPVDEKEEKFLREICNYEFTNLEEPGLMHTFSYGTSNNMHKFSLVHGGSYHFPRFIARHLEKCSTPLYEWRPDGSGRLVKKKIGDKARFSMRQQYSR